MELDLKQFIRDVPDFPSPGILFRDITPLLQSPEAMAAVVDAFVLHCRELDVDTVAAVEARGFLFGAPLAHRLGIPLVPVRKEGKLPFETHRVEYALEYGSDVVEIHTDGVTAGNRVIVVDDLLATGGTLVAACTLLQNAGATVESVALVIELSALSGREKLPGFNIFSLVQY